MLVFSIVVIIGLKNILQIIKKHEVIIFNENAILYNVKKTGGLTSNPVTINTVLGNIYIKANANIIFTYPPYIGSDSWEYYDMNYITISREDYEHDLILLDKNIEKIDNIWIMGNHISMNINHIIEIEGEYYGIDYISFYNGNDNILLSGTQRGTGYAIFNITSEGEIINKEIH
jgi:hypothetical protein